MAGKAKTGGRPVTEELPTIDHFMTLFIAALVLRGKKTIDIRGERAPQERRRMYALGEYLNERYHAERRDKDRSYFLLRLRNELSPGLIGAFDGFKHQLLVKIMTITSIDLVFPDYYNLDLQPVTARSYLQQADPFMRELAEGAATAYLANRE